MQWFEKKGRASTLSRQQARLEDATRRRRRQEHRHQDKPASSEYRAGQPQARDADRRLMNVAGATRCHSGTDDFRPRYRPDLAPTETGSARTFMRVQFVTRCAPVNSSVSRSTHANAAGRPHRGEA
jgi:hypothetical protein